MPDAGAAPRLDLPNPRHPPIEQRGAEGSVTPPRVRRQAQLLEERYGLRIIRRQRVGRSVRPASRLPATPPRPRSGPMNLPPLFGMLCGVGRWLGRVVRRVHGQRPRWPLRVRTTPAGAGFPDEGATMPARGIGHWVGCAAQDAPGSADAIGEWTPALSGRRPARSGQDSSRCCRVVGFRRLARVAPTAGGAEDALRCPSRSLLAVGMR